MREQLPQGSLDSMDSRLRDQHNILAADLYPHSDLSEVLLGSVRRCDYFADDGTDEFQIRREDGTNQGIFKVWAAPVIPVLDTEQLDVENAIETWSARNREKPLSLFESLEQWRAFSSVADRRLQEIYEVNPLPADPQDAIAEQFTRLNVAFAYGAPFYNLEALVADSREDRSDNPIDFQEGDSSGGKLDAVAMLLPAALKDQVTADTLNWNSLNWDHIDGQVANLREEFLKDSDSLGGRQYVQICKIAATASTTPSEVLFAANALQFIPADVGGKRDDLDQHEALTALETVLEAPTREITTEQVAKDANALIRFKNWTPSKRSPDNFQGKFWTYDGACRTAADLVEMIKQDPSLAFDEENARIFAEHLAPQLDGLDAASAKGRFMLQLYAEGKFNADLTSKIAERDAISTPNIIHALDKIQQDESVISVGDHADTYLIGGKATGLNRAMQLFGAEKVLGGEVVVTEAVSEWLASIEGVRELANQLESTSDTLEKVGLGEEIIRRINEAEAPEHIMDSIQANFAADSKLVLRSSSFDEDVDIIGPAPGVYESAVNIPVNDRQAIASGFKETVGSFFTDKAISFRELKGLRHKPLFAVLVQEFQPGAGGSIFIENGHVTLNTAPSPNQINDFSVADQIEEITFSSDTTAENLNSYRLSAQQLAEITEIAKTAEAVYGNSDMEFVINPRTNRIQLLQMRSLERPAGANAQEATKEPDVLHEVTNLDELPELEDDKTVGLIIDESIDLEKFQGSLFRWIISNRAKINTIMLSDKVPTTCHFANIIESLGIRIASSGK